MKPTLGTTLLIIIQIIKQSSTETVDWMEQPDRLYTVTPGRSVFLSWVYNSDSTSARYNFAKLESGVSRDLLVKHITSNYTQTSGGVRGLAGIALTLTGLTLEDSGVYELTVNTGTGGSMLISDKVKIQVSQPRGDVQPAPAVTSPSASISIPTATVTTSTNTTSAPCPVVVLEPGEIRHLASDEEDVLLYQVLALVFLITTIIFLLLTIVLAIVVYRLMRKRMTPEMRGKQKVTFRTEYGGDKVGKDEGDHVSILKLPLNGPSFPSLSSINKEKPGQTPQQSFEMMSPVGQQAAEEPLRPGDETDEEGKDEEDGAQQIMLPPLRSRLQRMASVTDYHWEVRKIEESVDVSRGYEIRDLTISLFKECP